jgi:hypothetical protein
MTGWIGEKMKPWPYGKFAKKTDAIYKRKPMNSSYDAEWNGKRLYPS